jgi:lysophospholipase L1-like esterase
VGNNGYTNGYTVAQSYNKNRRVSIISLACGANDWNNGTAAATTIANIQAWVAAVQTNAPNSYIAVQTIADHSGMTSGNGGYAWKDTVSAAIRLIPGIYVVDVQANPYLGCDGCSANPTYFLDGVHFSTLGGIPIQAGLQEAIMTEVGFK